MEASLQSTEKIYRRELSLFQELLNCLTLEKDNLINLDMENLWDLMEKKKKILESIEDGRQQMKKITEAGHFKKEQAGKGRRPFMKLSKKIDHLKEEIKARVKENVAFIHESLEFFDEIISIFTMGRRVEHSYSPLTKNQKEFSTRIYHREV